MNVITKDNIKQFTDQCFDKDNDKAVEIVKGILDARSPRLSDISNKMEGEVNIAGKWGKGFSEPMWLMTSEEPEKGLEIYSSRMKIEESFRDMKNLLDMEKIMNKKQVNMEKMIALLLIAYAIGFLIGEQIRDRVYLGKKWKLYSGLFILLKRKFQLSKEALMQVIDCAYAFFRGIIFGYVRTHV